MRENNVAQPLHVVGNDVVASLARRECAAGALQRQRAARAHAEHQVGMPPGAVDQIHDVPLERGRDMHAGRGASRREHIVGGRNRLEIFRAQRCRSLRREQPHFARRADDPPLTASSSSAIIECAGCCTMVGSLSVVEGFAPTMTNRALRSR